MIFLAGFAITLFGFDYIRQHWKCEPVTRAASPTTHDARYRSRRQTFKRIAPCMLFSIAATLTVIFLEQASAALTAAPDHATAVETNGLAAWVARGLIIAAWVPTISVWLFNVPRRFVHPLVRDERRVAAARSALAFRMDPASNLTPVARGLRRDSCLYLLISCPRLTPRQLSVPVDQPPAAYAATAASSRMSRVLLVSTRTPGPIVEAIVIVRRYLPLTELGLARMISSIRAA